MIEGIEEVVAHRAEELREGGCVVDLGPQGQDVDAMADQGVMAFRRLACGRHADDDVVLPRDTAEQDGEGGQQRGVETRAMRRAQALDRGDIGRVQRAVFAP